MAETFAFSLVSPERELFTGEVNSVLVPGIEGNFEVLANHAPFMSTISPGMLEIRQGDQTKKVYVRGGFADVTPAGLTILAELAVNEDELSGEIVAAERAAADQVLANDNADPDDILNAERTKNVLPTS